MKDYKIIRKWLKQMLKENKLECYYDFAASTKKQALKNLVKK